MNKTPHNNNSTTPHKNNSPHENVLKQVVSHEMSPTRQIHFHPRVSMYFAPSKGTEPEIDLNNTMFFKTYDELLEDDDYNPISNEWVRAAIFSKTWDRDGFPGTFMLREGPRIDPYHLPTPDDSTGIIHGGLLSYIEWEAWQEFDAIPANYLALIDPRPVLHIDQTPIYAVPIRKTPIFMGSYTDALHVMRISKHLQSVDLDVFYHEVKRRSRRYHQIQVSATDQYSGQLTKALLVKGLVVVIWNARGVTRPSFMIHFNEIFQKLNPALTIITESRIGEAPLLLLAQKLPGAYQHDVFGPTGRAGGVVMFWSVKDIQPSITQRMFTNSCFPDEVNHLVGLKFHVSFLQTCNTKPCRLYNKLDFQV